MGAVMRATRGRQIARFLIVAVIVLALLALAAGPLLAAPVTSIDRAAAAGRPATRLDTVAAPTMCESIAGAIARRHPGSTQQLVVRTSGWADTVAVVQLADLDGGRWVCGREMTGRIGSNGFRPLLERRSGDGTAPAGVFPLATMTAWDDQRFSFFGNAADPGVTAGAYRRVRSGDCFGATPNTSGYGHLRNDTACAGVDDEYLPDYVSSYTNAALIGANMEPDVSGDARGETPYAAAIFLHRHVYTTPGATTGATKPTSGCVSLSQGDLTSVLVGLRPDVRFVMGPTDWLLTTA
jgi:L,D-peptidoglycan transpeptidase YkuD (ErfK/YbiS/YcfS/YnhG family)